MTMPASDVRSKSMPEIEMLYGRMNGVPEVYFGPALVEELGDRVLSEMRYEMIHGSVVFYMEGAELCPL